MTIGSTDAGATAGFSMPAESATVARIAAVIGELAAAATMDDVVLVVASHVREAVGASVSTLMLRNGEQIVIAGQMGVPPDKAARWSSFDVADLNPASEAVRTGRPVIAATPEQVRYRYPGMAADTPVTRSVVSIPLRSRDEIVGVIGMTFEDNWCPGPFELDFLMTLADACAQAITRVQATFEAQRMADRLSFLARASAELAASLDYRATLTGVAELAVPELADWCTVDLLIDRQLVTLAVAHADPAKVSWAWRLRERFPIDMAAPSGAPAVVRTGVGELARDITDDLLAASMSDPEHLELARQLDMRSAMIVPLTARDRTLGVISFIRTNASPNFDDADLALAEDLGRRAGIAIDNARLYHDAARAALELQRAILPDVVDAIDGWTTAVCSRPADNARVGGDFYDTVRLRDGRLAVVLGDVMGHGIAAAAAMAQVRAAVRAFITVDPEPGALLNRLDAMFRDLRLDTLVTVTYVLVDPAGHILLGNAGHCPALLIGADSRVEFVRNAPRPPIGAGPATTVVDRIELQPGDVLLLYTDGVIERRDEPIDQGLERLATRAARRLGACLDTDVRRLVADLAEDEQHDDVTAFAIRRDALSKGSDAQS